MKAIEQYLQEKGFWNVFVACLVLEVGLGFLNSMTLKSVVLGHLIFALMGCVFFLFPIYPGNLLVKWRPEKCRQIVRVIGAISIILSLLGKVQY